MPRFVSILFLTLVLSGCQGAMLNSTSPPVVIPSVARDAISKDLAHAYAMTAGKSVGTILLNGQPAEFTAAMNRALQQEGYSLAREATGKQDTPAVSALVSLFADEGHAYAKMSVDGMTVTRTYLLNEGRTEPDGPLTVAKEDRGS